ncbi:MAG TPA: SAF domain-containing protein [Actinomycetales bacterium]|nr:SAF domain-containing protein [Actinomycetales bacterium]
MPDHTVSISPPTSPPPSAPTGPGTGAPTSGLGGALARRLRAPSWRDPRLLVGLLLVLGSITAGGLVVAAADDTVPVYVATRPLMPGDALDPADLTVVHARLDAAQPRYLVAASGPPRGRVLVRTVAAGELVPLSAVGSREQVELRPVSVPLPAEGSEQIKTGALVDVWVAARDRARGVGAYSAPRRVAAAVQVAGRSTRQGALGSSTSTAAQLLLGPDLLPRVIEAVDNEARITLVPVPATVPRSGS